MSSDSLVADDEDAVVLRRDARNRVFTADLPLIMTEREGEKERERRAGARAREREKRERGDE